MSTIVQEDRFSEVKERFKKLFDVFSTSLNGHKDPALFSYRQQAMDRLAGLSFPTRRDEDYKYTSFAPALKPAYQIGKATEVDKEVWSKWQYEELDAIQLVFVNGEPQTELSELNLPDGLEILSVPAALQHEKVKPFLTERLEHFSKETTNPFVVLNTAFGTGGVVIYAHRNKAIECPVHILHLIAPTEKPMLLNPQIWMMGEQSSEMTVIEQYEFLDGAGEVNLTNAVTQGHCYPNATIKHYRIQNQRKEDFFISNTEVYQDRDSTYTNNAADLGGDIVRNNLSAHLQDEGTSTNYYGIYFANAKQHIDNQSYIDHAHPHCNSNEFYKGILTDRARGVFNGKVMVRQDAQKTNAFQQNSSLVLSKNAQMDSKPQLEIFADDVKCSHGATIGQLDESSIYYLQTRGLSKEKARSLLQQAFLGEVLEFFGVESIKKYVEGLVEEKMK